MQEDKSEWAKVVPRSRRLCPRCYGGMCGQAFSEGVCEICGDKVVSAVYPADKLCMKCAVDRYRCVRCGKPMEDGTRWKMELEVT